MGISDERIISAQERRDRAYTEAGYFLKMQGSEERQLGQFAMRHFAPRSGSSDTSSKTQSENEMAIDRFLESLRR